MRSLKEVEDGSGDRFFFDGRRVFIKMTDEGDPSVDPDFREAGAVVYGTRYFNMWWVAGAAEEHWASAHAAAWSVCLLHCLPAMTWCGRASQRCCGAK